MGHSIYCPGIKNDVADLLTRAMSIKDEHWNPAQLIDGCDRNIVYAPLLFMARSYIFTKASLAACRGTSFYEEGNEEDAEEKEQLRDDSSRNWDWEHEPNWTEHEMALMTASMRTAARVTQLNAIAKAPVAVKIFRQSDYLSCPQFSKLYAAVWKNEHKDADTEAMVKDALAIRDARRKALRLPPLEGIKHTMSDRQVAANVRDYSIDNQLLYYRCDRHGWVLCVPQGVTSQGKHLRRIIFDELHKSPYSGHRGRDGTVRKFKAAFFWHGMMSDVDDMCLHCPTCNKTKFNRQAQQGLLTPVQLPIGPAQSYNMDFIDGLPKSRVHVRETTRVMLIIDRFSTFLWLFPCATNITAPEAAQLFTDRLCLEGARGVPLEIISDQDTLFTSNFWRTLWKRMGTSLKMATPRTQSTNGTAERMVAVVEEILRTCINYRQDDWAEWLPHICFVCNTALTDKLSAHSAAQVEMAFQPIAPTDMLAVVDGDSGKSALQLARKRQAIRPSRY